MYLEIYENRTGEAHVLRRLGPNERLNLRQHVQVWVQREYGDYGARASFAEPGSYIPNGCGDYQATIRRTKVDTGVLWTSEPFYMEFPER